MLGDLIHQNPLVTGGARLCLFILVFRGGWACLEGWLLGRQRRDVVAVAWITLAAVLHRLVVTQVGRNWHGFCYGLEQAWLGSRHTEMVWWCTLGLVLPVCMVALAFRISLRAEGASLFFDGWTLPELHRPPQRPRWITDPAAWSELEEQRGTRPDDRRPD